MSSISYLDGVPSHVDGGCSGVCMSMVLVPRFYSAIMYTPLLYEYNFYVMSNVINNVSSVM